MTTKKNIIYLIILLIFVSLFIYLIFINYLTLKNCENIDFSISEITCTKHSYDVELSKPTTITSHSINPFIVPFLVFILITLLFYQQITEQKISNFYNSICKQNIRKESYFIGTFLFLYCFILLSMFSKYLFATKSTSPLSFFGSTIIGLSITIPLMISIYSGKKWLNTETPKKLFSKMPVSTIIPSIIFSVILGVYLSFLFPGGQPPIIAFWIPLGAPVYISGIILLSLIFGVYLYNYKLQQNKTILKYIAIFVLFAIYILSIIGLIS